MAVCGLHAKAVRDASTAGLTAAHAAEQVRDIPFDTHPWDCRTSAHQDATLNASPICAWLGARVPNQPALFCLPSWGLSHGRLAAVHRHAIWHRMRMWNRAGGPVSPPGMSKRPCTLQYEPLYGLGAECQSRSVLAPATESTSFDVHEVRKPILVGFGIELSGLQMPLLCR